MAVGRNTNYTVEYRKKYKTQSGYNKDNWVFTGSYQNEYCDFYRLTDSGNHSERHENSDVFNATTIRQVLMLTAIERWL